MHVILWVFVTDATTVFVMDTSRSADVAAGQRVLHLAKITPWIPDVNVDATIQHDNTTAPFGTAYNLHAGIPIPLFDRNRGNIMSADAALLRACQEYNLRPQ